MSLAPGLLADAAVAGAIVVLTPGPAVIAFLGIGAAQGRREGAKFLIGHLAGDLLWSVLALVALVGAKLVAPWVFNALATFCGLYLAYLGARSLLARRKGKGTDALRPRRPLLRGLAFGLSNPKSYPVTLAVFTALLAGQLADFTLLQAPPLLASCFAGFIAADLLLVWLVGIGPVRRFYRRHEIWIIRATGLMFLGFAANALWHAWQGWTGEAAVRR
ncbi:MAG TPA: LysE family translocator [Dongiaceae bacterium]|nr:LysE family translocator [Dongiaceae bacterium]